MYLKAIGEALSYGTYLEDNDYWRTLATVVKVRFRELRPVTTTQYSRSEND